MGRGCRTRPPATADAGVPGHALGSGTGGAGPLVVAAAFVVLVVVVVVAATRAAKGGCRPACLTIPALGGSAPAWK